MQLKNKWYDYVFSAFGAAALLAATVFLAARWPMIAQQIPSHYDLFGQVDAWSGKGSLIEHLELRHDNLGAINTEKEERVRPSARKDSTFSDGSGSIILRPASWNSIRIKVR